ncbi:MAG: HAD-IA family hydrolase [Rhodobacteraceae bacterium]|nr:HAD-IA family hydrolase [Paracoccaceae bacterium]
MLQTSLKPKLIIFDCDGVLVDSEPVSNQVMVDNLARYGLQLTVAQSMDLFVGSTMAGAMSKARDKGAKLPDTWIEEVYAETYAALRAGVDLIDGISELLAALDKAGVNTCVASNGSRDKMRITLGQNGLWDRFQGRMFSAHELKTAKPDPGLFLAAAEHFDLNATDCVVIEDSPTGALAAHRAGMRCLGFAPSGAAERLTQHGATPFQRMDQVPPLVGL